jgi:hypothetical protein
MYRLNRKQNLTKRTSHFSKWPAKLKSFTGDNIQVVPRSHKARSNCYVTVDISLIKILPVTLCLTFSQRPAHYHYVQHNVQGLMNKFIPFLVWVHTSDSQSSDDYSVSSKIQCTYIHCQASHTLLITYVTMSRVMKHTQNVTFLPLNASHISLFFLAKVEII